MMQKIFSFILSISLFTFSTLAFAEFDIKGQATITYPTGITKTTAFNFALQKIKGKQYFLAGPYKMKAEEAPEKYSIAIFLHKDEYLWVQEFGQGYFQDLHYQLGDFLIEVKKDRTRKTKGQYTLAINGKKHLFDKNSVQLIIEFENKGIKKVSFEGTVKDMKM